MQKMSYRCRRPPVVGGRRQNEKKRKQLKFIKFKRKYGFTKVKRKSRELEEGIFKSCRMLIYQAILGFRS